MARFRDELSLQQRIAESRRIRSKYPDRVAVIVERAKGSVLPALLKRKYLVPQDLSVGQFSYVVRKRLALADNQAMLMFINGRLPPTGALLSTVYDAQRHDDGFLYCEVTGESVFG
jgi:GABA(A) receptor-associated protein